MPRRHGRRRTVALPRAAVSDLVRRLGHERTVGAGGRGASSLGASVLSVAPAARPAASAQTGDTVVPPATARLRAWSIGGAAIDPEAVGNVEEAYAPATARTPAPAADDAPQVALAEPAPGVTR